MENILVFILFGVGLILIVKGGDMFVDAASNAATIIGIPKFIIGATIVSFATTMPEMLVSIMAALDGRTEMAVGNAIGSVTANTGLIMALSIIFMPPSKVERRLYAPKSCMLIAALVSLWLLCFKGVFLARNSIVLFIIILLYVIENINDGKKKLTAKRAGYIPRKELWIQFIYFFIGAVAIIAGSRLLVDNGSIIARLFKVPENVIAITIVAIGTSLPELVTAITAIIKNEASLTAGNIIGANIIDTALILPLCAMVSGGEFKLSQNTIYIDIPVCLFIVCINLIPVMLTGKFRKSQGIISIIAYFLYIYTTCIIG